MTPTPTDIRKAREIVDRFSFSSNVIVNGRVVGMQVVVADAIAQALRAEREAERERCAGIAEHLNGWGSRDCDSCRKYADHIAKVIRRSEP